MGAGTWQLHSSPGGPGTRTAGLGDAVARTAVAHTATYTAREAACAALRVIDAHSPRARAALEGTGGARLAAGGEYGAQSSPPPRARSPAAAGGYGGGDYGGGYADEGGYADDGSAQASWQDERWREAGAQWPASPSNRADRPPVAFEFAPPPPLRAAAAHGGTPPRPPPMIICHLCGRPHGLAALRAHAVMCARRRAATQDALPPALRTAAVSPPRVAFPVALAARALGGVAAVGAGSSSPRRDGSHSPRDLSASDLASELRQLERYNAEALAAFRKSLPACALCEEPFEPVPADAAARGSPSSRLARACARCAAQHEARRARVARGAAAVASTIQALSSEVTRDRNRELESGWDPTPAPAPEARRTHASGEEAALRAYSTYEHEFEPTGRATAAGPATYFLDPPARAFAGHAVAHASASEPEHVQRARQLEKTAAGAAHTAKMAQAAAQRAAATAASAERVAAAAATAAAGARAASPARLSPRIFHPPPRWSEPAGPASGQSGGTGRQGGSPSSSPSAAARGGGGAAGARAQPSEAAIAEWQRRLSVERPPRMQARSPSARSPQPSAVSPGAQRRDEMQRWQTQQTPSEAWEAQDPSAGLRAREAARRTADDIRWQLAAAERAQPEKLSEHERMLASRRAVAAAQLGSVSRDLSPRHAAAAAAASAASAAASAYAQAASEEEGRSGRTYDPHLRLNTHRAATLAATTARLASGDSPLLASTVREVRAEVGLDLPVHLQALRLRYDTLCAQLEAEY